ncbi:MAG: hypothetical protein F6K47_24095 [Symploca sp. SIO2E6]|nr:hypothetical protein [Symploca sp. SIO2E6]
MFLFTILWGDGGDGGRGGWGGQGRQGRWGRGIEEGRGQKAEGRRVQFGWGFKPHPIASHQIEDSGGGLKPLLPLVARSTRTDSFCPGALVLLPSLKLILAVLPQFPIPYSLFPIPHSPFPIPYSLFPIPRYQIVAILETFP